MGFHNAKDLYMTALGITGHQSPDFKPAPSMFPSGADVSAPPTLPDGVHLRWLFGRERGFPKGGYWVFRRQHFHFEPIEVIAPAIDKILQEASQNNWPISRVSDWWGSFSCEDGHFRYPSGGGFFEESSLEGLSKPRDGETPELQLSFYSLNFLLKFDLPKGQLATCITLWIGFPEEYNLAVRSIPVIVYSDATRAHVVEQRNIPVERDKVVKVTFTHDAIAAIDLRLDAAVLAALEYEMLCPWLFWLPISSNIKLPVNHPKYNGQHTDLNASEDIAVARIDYGQSDIWRGKPFKDLHHHVLSLVEKGGDGPSMHRIEQEDVEGETGGGLKGVKPLDLVRLASLHPAVAQMLGLYLIDKDAKPDKEYDYLILACHQPMSADGIFKLFNIDHQNMALADYAGRYDTWICSRVRLQPHEPLQFPEPPRAYAIPRPGSLDQVGLHWATSASENLHFMRPGMPVWYQVYRTFLGENKPATSDQSSSSEFEPLEIPPTLASQMNTAPPSSPPSGWPPVSLPAVDHTITEEGWYAYKTAYIDLFGRYSVPSPPARWWQWEFPANEPKPWYFEEPTSAEPDIVRAIHDFAVGILAKQLPPPPSNLEAWALDPEDPMLLKDKAYQQWYDSLPSALKNVCGLRIRWQWTDVHKRQASHTAEFRIHRKEGRFNCLTGHTQDVEVMGDPQFARVETDITLPLGGVPSDYVGAVLQMGMEFFPIISIVSSDPLVLIVRNRDVEHTVPPRENAPCAIAIPKDHQAHPLFQSPTELTNWDHQQIAVTAIEESIVGRGVHPKPGLEGKGATINGNVVTIEFQIKPGLRGQKATADSSVITITERSLADVIPGLDFLWLAQETDDGIEGRLYTIESCDPTVETVILAEEPDFDGKPLTWAIYTKAVVKAGLRGQGATANGRVITILEEDLADVTTGVDFLWLDQTTDIETEGKLCPIEACDAETGTVTLTEDPGFDSQPLDWAVCIKAASRVEPGIDSLWLSEEAENGVFSIAEHDPIANTVTLTEAPILTGGELDWKIGTAYDQYEVFLPRTSPHPETLTLQRPNSDQGILYAQLGISVFSKHPNQPDDDRFFSESPIEGPREVFRILRQPPDPPEDVIYPDGNIYATRADYHGRSFYTYRWPAPAHSSLKTHVMRALDDAVFKLDWLMRTTRSALDPENPRHDKFFPKDWDLDYKRAVANQLNAIQSRQDYDSIFSNDARTLLKLLPGNNKKAWNYGLQDRDWEIRRTRKFLSADDRDYFPSDWYEPSNDPIDLQRRNGIANKLNAMIGLLSGEAATVEEAIVSLDNAPDLSRVRPYRDTVWLATDQRNSNRPYRIIAVDLDTHQVTLDRAPNLGASSSKWILYLDEYNFSQNDPLALNNDDLRVLAGLPGNEEAFTQITIEPLNSAVCEWMDTLDSKSRNRYFYRSAFVDRVQNKSGLSRATPPIYLPKVTPPRTPVVTKVLGGDREITLKWASNRESDLHEYWIYRTESKEAARDIRLMGEPVYVESVADDPTLWPSEVIWQDRNVEGLKDYFYRVIAVDMESNKSVPSRIMCGRAYQKPPASPVWVSAVRHNYIELSWTHPQLTELSFRIERQERMTDALGRSGRIRWVRISEWLEGGVDTFTDEIEEVISSAELIYRIETRDSLQQVAFEKPTIVVSELEIGGD